MPSLIFLVMARNNCVSDAAHFGTMILPCHTRYKICAQMEQWLNGLVAQWLNGSMAQWLMEQWLSG